MHALRRWPTCAALLGLVAVCSTSVFPAADAPALVRSSVPVVSRSVAAASTASAQVRTSRWALTYPGGVTVQARTRGIGAASRRAPRAGAGEGGGRPRGGG